MTCFTPLLFFKDSTSSLKQNDIEIIRHISIGQPSFVYCFICNNSDEENEKLFNKMASSLPPTDYKLLKQFPIRSFYYYHINLFRKAIGSEVFEIYLNNLKLIDKSWSELLYNAISQSSVLSEKQIKQLPSCIMSFFMKDPALLRALQNNINNLVEKVGLQSLFSSSDINALRVYTAIDQKSIALFPLSILSNKNIYDFFQVPTIIYQQPTGIAIEKVLSCQDPFPNELHLLSESNQLSLVNDSIVKKKHFADIVFNLAHIRLMTRDFPGVAQVLSLFDDLRPWSLLSDYEKISSDRDFFLNIIHYYEKEESCSNFLNRYRNDDTLIKYLSSELGESIQSSIFFHSSIPFLIRPALSNIEITKLEEISELSCLSISDLDRNQDFSLIFSAKAILLLIESFKGKTFEDIELDRILASITNSDILDRIITDLFSLLFLEDINGFVCPIDVAEIVVSSLITISKHHQLFPYLQVAVNKLQRGKIQSFETIDCCFESPTNSVVAFLENKQFDLAEFASVIDKKLHKMCQLANIMNEVIQNDSNDPNLILPIIKVELFLTKSIDLGLNSFDSSIINCIISKRKSSHQLDSIMDSICDKNRIGQIIQYANIVFELGYDGLSPIKVDSPLLNRFLSYIDTLHEYDIKPESMRVSSNIDIMNYYLHSGLIQDDYQLRKFIGENAIENMILFSNYEMIHPQTKSFLDSISPALYSFLYYKQSSTNLRFHSISQKYQHQIELIKYRGIDIDIFINDGNIFCSLKRNSHALSIDNHDFLNIISFLDELYFYMIPLSILSKIFELVSNSEQFLSLFEDFYYQYPDFIRFQNGFETDSMIQYSNVTGETNEMIENEIQTELIDYPLFSPIHQNTIETSLKLIDSIIVSSYDEEIAASLYLASVFRQIRLLLESKMLEKITWLKQFVDYGFFTRFGIVYSFKGVLLDDKISRLINICFDYDAIQLIVSSESIWMYSNDNSEYLFKQIFLGDYDFIEKMPQIPLNDLITNNNIIALSFPTLFLFKYEGEHDIIFESIFERSSAVIKGNGGNLINQEQMNSQKKYILCFLPFEFFFQKCAEYGYFGEILSNDRFSQLSVVEIINWVFNPMISFQHWDSFWRFFKKNGIPLIQYSNMNQALDLLNNKGTFILLAELYKRIELFEDSIVCYLTLLPNPNSWDSMLKVISFLKGVIEQEKIYRQKTKKVSKISNQKLHYYDVIARIQYQYAMMCKKRMIRFNRYHDLFNHEDSIINMAIMAFFCSEYSLVIQISDLIPERIFEISDQIIDKLLLSGQDSINSVFASLPTKLDSDGYQKLSDSLVSSMHKKIKHSMLSPFIVKNIQGLDFQISLLIKYGFLRDAISLSRKHGSKKNLLAIENAALELNDIEILKELSSNSKNK